MTKLMYNMDKYFKGGVIVAVRQVYFHTKTEQEADRCINSVPLIVNSTGVEYYRAPFKNGSTRKDFGLVYVVNGDMEFYIKGKMILVPKGGFIIGPPHEFKTFFGTKGDFLNYYWLNFTGRRAENLIKEMGLKHRQVYNVGVSEEISNCFKEIFNEFLINDEFFALRSEAGLIKLLSEVLRKAKSSENDYLKTIQYIHKHYNENISVERLADMEGFSYSYYYAVFKRITKMSPKEYINTQRVNSACFYLKGSTYSISEISELVGYSDQCYFSRIFKQKTGLSPKEYRNKRDVK